MSICNIQIPKQICDKTDLEQLRASTDVLKTLLCCLKDELRQEKSLVETQSGLTGSEFVFPITTNYAVHEDSIRFLWNGQERYRLGQGVPGELMWSFELVSPIKGKLIFTDEVISSHVAVFVTITKELDCFKDC